MIVNFDDIIQLVNKHPKHSFHEISGNNLNRMYFDIESKDHVIEENEILAQIRTMVALFNSDFVKYNIHIAQAHGPVIDDYGKVKFDENGEPKIKYSFHIVLDIACNKEINKFIAQRLKPYLKNAVDDGVYSPNHPMRLPNTVKITKHGFIENRKFIFNEGDKFEDFIVNDISKCYYTIGENMLFQSQTPLTIRWKSQELPEDILQ